MELQTAAVQLAVQQLDHLSNVVSGDGAVSQVGAEGADRTPDGVHLSDGGLSDGSVSHGCGLSGSDDGSSDIRILSQSGDSGSDVAQLEAQQLGVSGSQECSELHSSLHVLGVGVDTDSLGAGVGLQLLGLTVDHNGGSGDSAQLVAQDGVQAFLAAKVPGTGEVSNNGAVLQASVAVAVAVNNKVGVVQQIQNSVGGVDADLAAKVDTGSSVSTGLTEQGAAGSEEECGQVSGVLDLEGNLALLQDGLQRGQISIADQFLVVVHEPGGGSHGEAVDGAVGGSDGVDVSSRDVILNLSQEIAAQLSQSAGLQQGAQLVVCEHVNVSSGRGVSSDHGSSVALGANAVVPGDSVLGVSSLELCLNLDQPGVGIDLVLLGSPDLQGDSLGLVVFSRSLSLVVASLGSLGLVGVAAATGDQGQSHDEDQQQSNDLLHFVFLLMIIHICNHSLICAVKAKVYFPGKKRKIETDTLFHEYHKLETFYKILKRFHIHFKVYH